MKASGHCSGSRRSRRADVVRQGVVDAALDLALEAQAHAVRVVVHHAVDIVLQHARRPARERRLARRSAAARPRDPASAGGAGARSRWESSASPKPLHCAKLHRMTEQRRQDRRIEQHHAARHAGPVRRRQQAQVAAQRMTDQPHRRVGALALDQLEQLVAQVRPVQADREALVVAELLERDARAARPRARPRTAGGRCRPESRWRARRPAPAGAIDGRRASHDALRRIADLAHRLVAPGGHLQRQPVARPAAPVRILQRVEDLAQPLAPSCCAPSGNRGCSRRCRRPGRCAADSPRRRAGRAAGRPTGWSSSSSPSTPAPPWPPRRAAYPARAADPAPACRTSTRRSGRSRSRASTSMKLPAE